MRRIVFLYHRAAVVEVEHGRPISALWRQHYGVGIEGSIPGRDVAA